MEHFINHILEKMPGVAKPQKKFLVILFLTILLLRGKVNFRNMSRYSDLNEKTYSRQFRKPFDFADFNNQLIEESVPRHHEKIAVMACSLITKSGKETYGLGFFDDSSHDQAAKGLEVSNLAVIDVTDNTGYSLSGWQTPPPEEIEGLVAGQRSAHRDGQQAAEEITRVDF
jgi:hypothetical protein